MSQSLLTSEALFRQTSGKYTNDNNIIDELWVNIARNYNNSKRYYHNLHHLADVWTQLQPPATEQNHDILLFATLYHDIIYSVTAKDNEEQSAEVATKALTRLTIPQAIIKKVELCILATKHHQPTGNITTDLFTDADMSILGRDHDTYATYARNVRKEYNLYPDLLYNPGRKKVLHSFLQMERIYKTDHFYSLYEQQARENIEWEITTL